MSSDESINPWRKTATREVYDNPWIRVREDGVVRPDGQLGVYGVVHFKNIAVGVLAVEGDELYLVGQYRYTLDSYSWEIPEGGCPEGEEPVEAARRELRKRRGYARDAGRSWGKRISQIPRPTNAPSGFSPPISRRVSRTPTAPSS